VYRRCLKLQDKDYMQIAEKEALKAQGMTLSNPLVGAVLVKNDHVLATGYHHGFGREHAEVNVIGNLNNEKNAKGATLYVTLEPCNHYGKQPPCSKKIVEAGIKKVVIGQIDPHEIVSGQGIKYLESHGVKTKVIGGTEYLNEAYNFFNKYHRPFVTLKYAMSIDGKINETGQKRTILTGNEAQIDAQKLRLCNQAILIGANTLRIDHPQLTVRIKNLPHPPIRIILIRDVNQINFEETLFKLPGEIWLLSNKKLLKKTKVNVENFVSSEWTADKIIQLLIKKEVQSLLVEGGSNIHAQFITAGFADKIVTYISPVILGGAALPVDTGQRLLQQMHYKFDCMQNLGQDICICARRE
jgi:diaminohydroxyphosphoribosylaminopyrimidine deaminase / 5-amino-6-(5-phosphoribosylamino)uracil reductase